MLLLFFYCWDFNLIQNLTFDLFLCALLHVSWEARDIKFSICSSVKTSGTVHWIQPSQWTAAAVTLFLIIFTMFISQCSPQLELPIFVVLMGVVWMHFFWCLFYLGSNDKLPKVQMLNSRHSLLVYSSLCSCIVFFSSSVTLSHC